MDTIDKPPEDGAEETPTSHAARPKKPVTKKIKINNS
jgi:hypothetical protein